MLSQTLTTVVHSLRRRFAKLLRDFSARLIGRGVDTSGRLSADVAGAMADMPAVTHHDGPVAVLLPQRLDLAGIDGAAFARDEPLMFEALKQTCTSCQHWRRCARCVATGTGGDELSDICPNTVVIDAIAVAQRRRIR